MPTIAIAVRSSRTMTVNERDSASRMRLTSLVKREIRVPVGTLCTVARSASMDDTRFPVWGKTLVSEKSCVPVPVIVIFMTAPEFIYYRLDEMVSANG